MARRTTAEAASPFESAQDREREREAKRAAVLRTAARAFNRNGFHATSLDDVAATLKVTKPTIYHYFAKKDEILFECTRHGLGGIEAAMLASEAAGGTGADRLHAMLTSYALSMLDDYGICVARTQDTMLSPASARRFRALKRRIDGTIRQALAAGRADGSLDVADPRIAAFALAGALNGLGIWFDPAGPRSAEQVARLTVDTLMTGLTHRRIEP